MYERNENDLTRRIRALPELKPGPDARNRVLDAMAVAADAAPSPVSDTKTAGYRGFAMAAGLGAVAILSALFALSMLPGYVGIDGSADATAIADYRELIEQSRQLEFVLANMPTQRRLMRADTAATIALLETQIAVIDEQLNFSAARDVEPAIRHALWRDRVDAMDALVQVRYAQSQVFTF